MTRALTILLQTAEHERDQALTALQQAQSQVQALQQQAEQLQTYRVETEARDPSRDGRATGIEALLGHRSFLERLRKAQELLQSQLGQAELRAQAAQVDLLARELRVAQVRKLEERRALENQKLTDRRDQRSSDDASQQRLLHARAQTRESAEASDTKHDSRY